MQKRMKVGLIGAAAGIAAVVSSCLYERHWVNQQPEIRYENTRIESVDPRSNGNVNVGFHYWTELTFAADQRRIVYGEGVSSEFKVGDHIDVAAKPRLFDPRLIGTGIKRHTE